MAIPPPRRSQIRWMRSAIVLLAVIASFVATYALCARAHAQPGPAILSALLAIGLARRGDRPHGRNVVLAPLAIAGTAIVAAAIGALLHAVPIAGAAVFTGGMFLSVWLRNFGERGRRAGSIVALPFVGMLVAPAQAHAPGGVAIDVALVIAAGLFAHAFATIASAVSDRIGTKPQAKRVAPPERAARASGAGWSTTTRMALQMACAISAAFGAGFTFFASHWGWTVLTAFIVCSGARGRGDAAYKGMLRLTGALAGTVLAAVPILLWRPSGPAEAALIFLVLFAGLALRDVNYAFWAACMTLVFALLAPASQSPSFALLAGRLEAILVGAICGGVAAWFVYPIRTESVVRRRLADALLALDELVQRAHLSDADRATTLATFEHRLAALEDVAAPVRWHRRLFARTRPLDHPARWIDAASSFAPSAREFGSQHTSDERRRGAVRRAIGAARRSIAFHGKADAPPEVTTIDASLRSLEAVLANTKGGS